MPAAAKIESLRLEQARALHEAARSSCVIVCFLVLYVAILLLGKARPDQALLWTSATLAMVGVTFLYSRSRTTIDRTNYQGYLKGHIAVSCATGLVWSGIAIAQMDPDSWLSLFISIAIPTSITLGGMFPSSTYRPTYLGLLTCCVLPVFFYWLVAVEAPLKYVAFGLLTFYLFGLFTSARTEIGTRDLMLARQTRRLNEELQRQKDLLKQVDAEKTRFLVSSVHDFSQPLHAQGYFIHALRERLETRDQIELLDRIEASWHSQSELMQGISDIARLESGLAEPELGDLDLHALADSVAAEFSRDAALENIDYRVTLEPCVTHADPALLARILRNLISNAIKFSDPGGRVEISCGPAPDGCELRVTDQGPGIPESDHQRIFEEYTRLPGTTGREGLGVGLAIVRRYADLLGIGLQLASSPGAGTSFTLSLPAPRSGACAESAPTDSRAIEQAPLVVIVDDQADIRDAMATLLANWGCRVVTAASGSEAIRALVSETDAPALLVVDNRLGDGERGAQVIDRLRDEVNETVPALLISGEIYDVPLPEDAEALSVLTKPVDPRLLREHLNELGALAA